MAARQGAFRGGQNGCVSPVPLNSIEGNKKGARWVLRKPKISVTIDIFKKRRSLQRRNGIS